MATKTYKVKQINAYSGTETAQSNLEAYIKGTVADVGTVSITNIRNDAFKGCSSLTTFTSSRDIISIGNSAFEGCTALSTIDINAAETIGERAFYNCSNLSLNSNYLNALTIGQSAFYGCSSLSGYISMRGSTTIGSDAFAYSGIIGSYVPSNVYDYAFRNAKNLVIVDLPREFTYNPTGLFSGCSALTTLNGSRYLTSIPAMMFYNCTSLTSVDISNATDIGLEAFRGCSSLQSITIGKVTTSLNSYTFAGCTSLTNITYKGTVAQAETVFRNLSNNVPATQIQCSDGVYTR